jgi:hypothetical protein
MEIAGFIKVDHNFRKKVQLNATDRQVQIHMVQEGNVVMVKMDN